MSSVLWEIFICGLEALLYTYLLYKRIGTKPNKKRRLIVVFFTYATCSSILTILQATLFLKMAILWIVLIFIVIWGFDCRSIRKRNRAILWASTPILIATVADYVSYSIALAILGGGLEQLSQNTNMRMQFMLIYVLVTALMVWLLTHWGKHNEEIPISITLVLFALIGIGIFEVESLIDLALALQKTAGNAVQVHSLYRMGYFLLLMLFALLIAFESLANSLRRNRELRERQQLATMEEQQYQFMVSTAESLAEWKHDYAGQLRLIAALIREENYAELQQYTLAMEAELGSSASLPLTGNRTVDAVISLRIMDAKRYQIPFETKIYLPDRLPLPEVPFSSLLGNILDNAIEACRKLESERAHVYLEVKPWKRMLFLFCSNSSDGRYRMENKETLLSTKKDKGHGIGMRRIRDIVEEAGGTCQFCAEETSFSVSVMIPLSEGST